jgi:hypothetical protein
MPEPCCTPQRLPLTQECDPIWFSIIRSTSPASPSLAESSCVAGSGQPLLRHRFFSATTPKTWRLALCPVPILTSALALTLSISLYPTSNHPSYPFLAPELRSIDLLMTTIAPSNSRGMGWRKPVPAYIPTPPTSRPTSETSFTLASVVSGGNTGKGPTVAVAGPETSQPPVSPPFLHLPRAGAEGELTVFPKDARQLAPYCQECLSRFLRW